MDCPDVPPRIEYRPPFSLDSSRTFMVAAMPPPVTPMLLRVVQRDPDGVRMLDA
jgi:hypothetical protein